MHLRPVLAAAAALAAVTLGLVPASAQRQTDPLGQRVDRPKMLRKGPPGMRVRPISQS